MEELVQQLLARGRRELVDHVAGGVGQRGAEPERLLEGPAGIETYRALIGGPSTLPPRRRFLRISFLRVRPADLDPALRRRGSALPPNLRGSGSRHGHPRNPC